MKKLDKKKKELQLDEELAQNGLLIFIASIVTIGLVVTLLFDISFF